MTDTLSCSEISKLRELLVRAQTSAAVHQSSGAALRETNLALAERVIHSRRARALIFGTDLFCDPAHDILLYLFTTNGLNASISIAQACASAEAAESTAFRYIKVLIDKGYVERSPHPQDKRIVTVKLSPMGLEGVDRWLTRFGDALAKPPGALT